MRMSPTVRSRSRITVPLQVAIMVSLLLARGPLKVSAESAQPARSAPVSGSCEPAAVRPMWAPSDGWVALDYLFWWTRGMSLPPLVTTSPAGTPLPDAGVLGEPATTVLFGDEQVSDELRSGFRFETGIWLDRACSQCIAVRFLCAGEPERFLSGLLRRRSDPRTPDH